MKRDNILVSVSGGRSSAVMARIVQTSLKYSGFTKHFVFCNTSRESQGTYDFLRKMELDWRVPLIYLEGIYPREIGQGVKARTVDFKKLKRDGSLFEEMIEFQFKTKGPSLPSTSQPFCSGLLKQKVARSFMRDLVGTRRYVTALGYRLEDMPHRVSYAALAATNEYICPLIQDFAIPLSQYDIQDILDLNTFDLSHSSKFGNCKICWKASDASVVERAKIYPEDAAFVRYLELKYNDVMFRGRRRLDDVLDDRFKGMNSLFDNSIDDSCNCGL